MLPHPLNRGSHCLPPCCARAHMDAMVDRERLQHHSQRVGWARRGIMRRCLRRALLQPSLVFGRSGQPVSMLFPPCSQVYLGCRDGVPMIPGGRSGSGREPRSDALRPRQSCRMGTRSEADRSRSARLLDACDIADFAFCPPQKVRRFPWLWGRRESIAGPIEH